MQLPSTITEEQFIEAFQRVVERIKRKYKYSIHDGDDLAQEALFIAVSTDPKSMGVVWKYNPETGPLYNYLSVAINNRIINFIRNKRHREIDAVNIFNVEEETIKIGNMKTTDDEFWRMIDEHLPAEYRTDYLKMRQGIAITKIRKMKLMDELRRIVDEFL
jgi:RNA polymerase sigma factor (sigma-70 family)